ncbi:type VII secretion target [Streptomyces sp. NPDC005438]|uniref:WXG100 family type VII secretion target n=1 Tax=Streptomyces sp. NPDC005438 TaxID=3156880 RepID=UPI0033B26D15
MSFEQEWAALKAQHSQPSEGGVATRLNSLESAGSAKLKVTSSVLRSKASKADGVARDFAKADNDTLKETRQVKSGLKGFRSAAAFDDFEDRWTSQMNYVKGLLTNGVADALRRAAETFHAQDKHRAERFRGDGKDDGGKRQKVPH